jgi:hypothetical protein
VLYKAGKGFCLHPQDEPWHRVTGTWKAPKMKKKKKKKNAMTANVMVAVGPGSDHIHFEIMITQVMATGNHD